MQPEHPVILSKNIDRLSKIASPAPSHHTASPSIVADAVANAATPAVMRSRGA
jgi:hypothetical protein